MSRPASSDSECGVGRCYDWCFLMVEYKNLNLYYRDFTREATVTTVYSVCVVKVESVGSIAVPDLHRSSDPEW